MKLSKTTQRSFLISKKFSNETFQNSKWWLFKVDDSTFHKMDYQTIFTSLKNSRYFSA